MEKFTMLIVDDVEINRTILKNIFKDEYCILEAENGKTAWTILTEGKHVDIIILDMIMPVMDGEKFLRLLRSDSRFCKLPVIVSSQFAEEDDEFYALELFSPTQKTITLRLCKS